MKSILYLLILILSITTQTKSCTIISVKNASTSLIGSNYDLSKAHIKEFGDMYSWTSPAKNNKYGAIYLSFKPSLYSATSGLNEKGLYYDWASLNESSTKPYDKNKPTYFGFLPYKIMEECSTTEEAIEIVKKYNWGIESQGGHMMIADCNGNSAVFEWLKGELVILKGDKNQIITNTPLAYCEKNYNKCWRLSKAHKMLDGISVSEESLQKTLKSVAQKDDIETLVSRIIDLKKREITMYYQRNFDVPVVIRLDDELKKGLHYECIPSLFNENNTNCSSEHKMEFYYDEDWKEIPTSKKAIYVRKITSDPTSTELIVRDYFFKSKKIQYEAKYENYDAIILNRQNGIGVWYYENGKKSRESEFLNNKLNGKSTLWNEAGEVKNESVYDNCVLISEVDHSK